MTNIESQKAAVIIGYSGHSYVVCDILIKNNTKIIGYCDLTEKAANPFDLTFLGNESTRDFGDEEVFITIGDNNLRQNIYKNLISKVNFCNAFHPSAAIGLLVTFDKLIMIGPKAVINTLSALGTGAIINSGAIVEHECVIDDFAHIGPGAILAGNVRVGKRTFIGAGAVVREGVKICDDVLVGAAAVVVKDITEPGTYVGIPARKK
jgi:sugar O-acyltransferase (sialic acid O-acetyltransferase NeuD family)